MNLETGAVSKVRELIAEENNPNLMLRVFVQGGGCSGFSYGFTFEETKNEDDFDFAYDEVKVVVDAMSMLLQPVVVYLALQFRSIFWV